MAEVAEPHFCSPIDFGMFHITADGEETLCDHYTVDGHELLCTVEGSDQHELDCEECWEEYRDGGD